MVEGGAVVGPTQLGNVVTLLRKTIDCLIADLTFGKF